MQIYVVRHGETEWNRGEIFRGTKDVPLNEVGKKQAEKVGRFFIDKDIVKIVSSPLMRAKQTAEAISKVTNVPVQRLDEFTDMNFGIWEGLSLKEVKDQYPKEFEIWRHTPHKLRVTNGETLFQVRKRMKKGFEKVVLGERGNIVIVTHRVLCKLIVLHALNIPNSHFWDIKFDPASITLIEKKGSNLTLQFLNDTCHLTGKNVISAVKDF